MSASSLGCTRLPGPRLFSPAKCVRIGARLAIRNDGAGGPEAAATAGAAGDLDEVPIAAASAPAEPRVSAPPGLAGEPAVSSSGIGEGPAAAEATWPTPSSLPLQAQAEGGLVLVEEGVAQKVPEVEGEDGNALHTEASCSVTAPGSPCSCIAAESPLLRGGRGRGGGEARRRPGHEEHVYELSLRLFASIRAVSQHAR